ncbi:hypothetical protein [Bradyrhizobium elkanii]|uniref:hypothetical protein n=1 Tax=Bradyrhizobium elkanii TaxID=29448 RepID=UPI0004AFC8F1|nr:hypothetical protein [Bradyrhizobium elkanii]
MLPSTPDERQAIIDYMNWQAPDLIVEFLQKVYAENVLSHQHVVWDVHTNVDRWWVITNPTNLYSQEQFPNMDLAVTFHVGLCLRMPRSQKTKLSELQVEPLAACFRYLSEASDALANAQEVSDFQAIGVRCREALLAFTSAAQVIVPWTGDEGSIPKQADFKAWADHICSTCLGGHKHEHRRHLFKTLLDESWRFSNWLTHAKASTWHDAEAATTTVEHALGLAASLVIRHVRGVPDACPACGSTRLSPQRGFHSSIPDVEWERPTCDKCGWTGDAVPILADPEAYAAEDEDPPPAEGECIVPTVPLRELRKPSARNSE